MYRKGIMEIDIPGESDGSSGVKENGYQLYPVSANDSGEGLPYAPVDWPNPGDIWTWKVGRRVAHNGYFVDRYLYLPSTLYQKPSKRRSFASKLSVEQYIRTTFPGADVDAFFASFSWKIPAKKLSAMRGSEEEQTPIDITLEETAEPLGSDSQVGAVGCRAGNVMCSSLEELNNSSSRAMACDVCCSEPGFCRDCCCILCSKIVTLAHGGYSFIKCEALIVDNLICGHIAHIECALRSYMAGTVGGSIGLDAEYYCRRCDTRTELVSHVRKLLCTCKSIDSQNEIEKILNVGICILRGSEKTNAKRLLHHIELVMAKLKKGTPLEDIWKTEDGSTANEGALSNNGNDAMEVTYHQKPVDFEAGSPQFLSGAFDPRIEAPKLEDEIDQVLQTLRKSQESEYIIAEERLYAQKNYLLNLYQQLDKERAELSTRTSSNDPDAMLEAVLQRVDQIKREIIKLRDMEEVAKGFGRTSKEILKQHFGIETEY
ncbi:hypothetical protein NMG60_11002314 [Bertholletia excelsa]